MALAVWALAGFGMTLIYESDRNNSTPVFIIGFILVVFGFILAVITSLS